MNKYKKPKPPLFQLLVQSFIDNKYFGARKIRNKELWTLLKRDDKFQFDIKKIRERLKVPKLNPKEDVLVVSYSAPDPLPEVIDGESEWLTYQKKSVRDFLHASIENLIKVYNLPKNFCDWLKDYILYSKPPPYKPLYNIELVQQMMDDPAEIERVPLTTGEKKFAKELVADRLGIKGRPEKEIGQAYREFLDLLSKSKNKLRRFRRFETALKTLPIGKPVEVIERGNQKKIERFTYAKLVAQEHSEEDGLNDRRYMQRYRKQRQRLKERTQKLLGYKK